MATPSDLKIERILIELDQMCDAFERRGWHMQAAEAEQLYANTLRRVGKAVPTSRSHRLMRELAQGVQRSRRATDFR
jgi:hypothetical protein